MLAVPDAELPLTAQQRWQQYSLRKPNPHAPSSPFTAAARWAPRCWRRWRHWVGTQPVRTAYSASPTSTLPWHSPARPARWRAVPRVRAPAAGLAAIGAQCFTLASSDKLLYHAAAVFCHQLPAGVAGYGRGPLDTHRHAARAGGPRPRRTAAQCRGQHHNVGPQAALTGLPRGRSHRDRAPGAPPLPSGDRRGRLWRTQRWRCAWLRTKTAV